MNNLLRKKTNELTKKKKKGFTLVELIIVIAIIAILAAIAIPKLGSIRGTANDKADIATAKTIQTVVAAAIADGKITAPVTAHDTTTAISSFSIADQIDGGSARLDSKVSPGTKFYVEVTSAGNVVVTRGNGGDILAGSRS